jgi:hypothetical protein
MNIDALVLAILAVGDIALIVFLRRRHAERVRKERIMASLCLAVRRANGIDELPVRRSLQRAS